MKFPLITIFSRDDLRTFFPDETRAISRYNIRVNRLNRALEVYLNFFSGLFYHLETS